MCKSSPDVDMTLIGPEMDMKGTWYIVICYIVNMYRFPQAWTRNNKNEKNNNNKNRHGNLVKERKEKKSWAEEMAEKAQIGLIKERERIKVKEE
jgi:hypothetical protein